MCWSTHSPTGDNAKHIVAVRNKMALVRKHVKDDHGMEDSDMQQLYGGILGLKVQRTNTADKALR